MWHRPTPSLFDIGSSFGVCPNMFQDIPKRFTRTSFSPHKTPRCCRQTPRRLLLLMVSPFLMCGRLFLQKYEQTGSIPAAQVSNAAMRLPGKHLYCSGFGAGISWVSWGCRKRRQQQLVGSEIGRLASWLVTGPRVVPMASICLSISRWLFCVFSAPGLMPLKRVGRVGSSSLDTSWDLFEQLAVCADVAAPTRLWREGQVGRNGRQRISCLFLRS